MPSSFPDALSVVAAWVQALRPASVLDVGIGFGKYGVLFREYLDVSPRSERGRDTAPAAVRIDGIEAWEPYVGPLQRAIYDRIHVGDALAVLPSLGRYELVFAADVLEHFTRDDGERFLDAAAAHATLGVLIVTPALDLEQGEVLGNPFERHRSFWTPGDFVRRPGADVLVWRRQLLAFVPTGARRVPLPRASVREALGQAAKAALAGVLGPVRAERVLHARRRRR
ncbi:MAG TPA: class I SAM-dependent methyltransferase [Solirubrobacter sp.]|nr:class I SAM-dependent methyltransferase [Solirubrobacter sp.]